MNIYVGNLAFNTTDDELRNAFAPFGEISSLKIVHDRDTGRSKGFAFVEMPSQEEGQNAINGLNDKEIKGRKIKVNEARPRDEKPSFSKGRR